MDAKLASGLTAKAHELFDALHYAGRTGLPLMDAAKGYSLGAVKELRDAGHAVVRADSSGRRDLYLSSF